MTRGVKVRLMAFVVLSAVGIVYIAATYLGLVDKVLGRGITVHATLPSSGGLFEGSEVTYRGVKVGKVADMKATDDGVRLELSLEEGTKIPLGSPMYVHNLSAVGEQYLDFEPTDEKAPYAGEGDTFTGTAKSLPVGEDELLVELNDFVQSVDKENLGVVIGELGTLFRDTGRPLQKLLDNGVLFIDEASKNQDATVRLLQNSLTVLRTQRDQGENIKGFSRNLAQLTGSLAARDKELRTVLQGTPGAVRQVQGLLEELEPTLPVLLGNLVTVDQVIVNHLGGVEQLLVSFPRAVAAGFTGTPGDGWGHVNLQFAQDPGPCKGVGYKPVSEWRRGDDLTDSPIYPAKCLAGAPFNQRGSKYSPEAGSSTGRVFRGGYDPATGATEGLYDADGNQVRMHQPVDLSVMGGDAWKWLLVGPVSQ